VGPFWSSRAARLHLPAQVVLGELKDSGSLRGQARRAGSDWLCGPSRFNPPGLFSYSCSWREDEPRSHEEETQASQPAESKWDRRGAAPTQCVDQQCHKHLAEDDRGQPGGDTDARKREGDPRDDAKAQDACQDHYGCAYGCYRLNGPGIPEESQQEKNNSDDGSSGKINQKPRADWPNESAGPVGKG